MRDGRARQPCAGNARRRARNIFFARDLPLESRLACQSRRRAAGCRCWLAAAPRRRSPHRPRRSDLDRPGRRGERSPQQAVDDWSAAAPPQIRGGVYASVDDFYAFVDGGGLAGLLRLRGGAAATHQLPRIPRAATGQSCLQPPVPPWPSCLRWRGAMRHLCSPGRGAWPPSLVTGAGYHVDPPWVHVCHDAVTKTS